MSLSTESPSIVVFAGPTGGHVFPALSFGEGFRNCYPQARIILVTCSRAASLIEQMPKKIFDSVVFLPEFGFPGKLSWKTVKPFLILPYLFFQAFFFLKKIKPYLCVGFGSFVSYPGMMTAHWLKIPTLIHEQNCVPGKATEWLVPHMDCVAESFEKTKFHQRPKRLMTVGLPLRSFMLEAALAKKQHSTSRLFTLLVVGGSQGAVGLNSLVMEAITALSDEERARIAVIHITGKQDLARVAACYERLAISHEIYSFHARMSELFQKADLAITRAGANTLFELAAFALPALVIPYPYAGGHQKYNAMSFAENQGLIYHDESPAAKIWLLEEIRKILENPQSLVEKAKAIQKLARPHATDRLIEIAMEMKQ